jgi:hypothetical protein
LELPSFFFPEVAEDMLRRMQNVQEVFSGLLAIASGRRGFLAGSSSSELFSFMANAYRGCVIHSTTALSWLRL